MDACRESRRRPSPAGCGTYMGRVRVKAREGGVHWAGPEQSKQGRVLRRRRLRNVCDGSVHASHDKEADGRRAQYANTFAEREHALLTGWPLGWRRWAATCCSADVAAGASGIRSARLRMPCPRRIVPHVQPKPDEHSFLGVSLGPYFLPPITFLSDTRTRACRRSQKM